MSINDILNNDNNINTNINNSSNINNINNEKVIISIKSCKNITSKQALLIIPITQYFSNKYILNKLITVLKGESISLRLIDWFVTNYCKKFNVMYNLNEFIDNYVDKDILNQSVSSFDNYILVHNNYNF